MAMLEGQCLLTISQIGFPMTLKEPMNYDITSSALEMPWNLMSNPGKYPKY